MVRLYVDDQRPAPEGWTVVRSADSAIGALRAGNVTHVSLDFDLGDPRLGTGLSVLDWLERALEAGRVELPNLEAHSGSPVGRRKLEARIADIVARYAQPTSPPAVDDS